MRLLSVSLILFAALVPRPALAADPEVTVTLTAVPTNASVGDMVRLEAKVTMVPQAGHYPQAEYPEIVSPVVTDFVREVFS